MATFATKSALFLLAAATLILGSLGLQRLEHPVKPDGSLSFLVIGDWGRRGEYNQSNVAHQMGITGEKLNIDFVVSVGDNFYESGLTDVDDKNFEESFTNIYTAKSLQKQWYSVLGNHDYRGNAMAQFNPVLRNIDSRWLCIRNFVLNAEIAEFFFVDTTPFVQTYWINPLDHRYDWREVAPRETYLKNLLEDLDNALKESSAPWKIVFGHHTIRSVSNHGDTIELNDFLLPLLQKHGVDIYINGHDHCLQHISSRDSPIQYVTSGGGSKAWRGIYTPNADKVQFFHDGQGYISVQLNKGFAEISYYDVFGKVMYKWSATKA